jgi:ketosteroid isomerase-like protein
MAGNRQNTKAGTQVPDPIAPPAASQPAEAVELVCLAVSDGDLEAALAQYEAEAPLRPWARYPDGAADQITEILLELIDLRLPLSVRISAIVAADGVALVLGERRIAGTGPDRQWVQLSGSGATVVRCQRDGSWRIAADAWNLGDPRAGHAEG